MRFLLAAFVLMGLSSALPAHAQQQEGILFSPGFLFFDYQDRNSGTNLAKVDAKYYDIKLGYIMSNGVYLGALYSKMERTDDTTDRNRTSYGAGVGYVYHQFYLMAHYLVSSELVVDTSNTWKDGSGFQFDLGYWFNVTGPFYAGPQLVYRSLKYQKVNSTSVTNTDSKETLPFLSLAFIF